MRGSIVPANIGIAGGKDASSSDYESAEVLQKDMAYFDSAGDFVSDSLSL